MTPEEMKHHIKADQKEFTELLDKNEDMEEKLEDMKEEDKEAIKKLSHDVAVRILEKLAAEEEQFQSEDIPIFEQGPNGLVRVPNKQRKFL